MADSSISEASLKASITERLKAVHVEVTDMSGESTSLCNAAPELCRIPCSSMAWLTNVDPPRWLWSSLYDIDCVPRIHWKELSQETSACQCSSQRGNSRNTRLDRQVPDTRGIQQGSGCDWCRWAIARWDSRGQGRGSLRLKHARFIYNVCGVRRRGSLRGFQKSSGCTNWISFMNVLN